MSQKREQEQSSGIRSLFCFDVAFFGVLFYSQHQEVEKCSWDEGE
jgi:hypothetical protein